MESINIGKIENVESLKINGDIITSEADVIHDPKNPDRVFKLLYNKNGLYFSNKLYTINSLIDLSGKIEAPEIVFPTRLLSVDDKVVGFAMPLVSGISLEKLLKDPSVDINSKTKYLKQVGTILDRMAAIRKENPESNWYLNDLHAGNFMVDLLEGKLLAIDLDSCRILGNHPFLSKYLSMFSPLSKFPNKYNSNMIYSCGGEYVADANSDLYCYAMLVLEFLYGARVNTLSVEEYFIYLEYLKSIGCPEELIDAFAKVYSNDDNVNFASLLDSIPHFYKNAHEQAYLKRVK